ncbi:MAG TPA: hypothetical protein QGH84_02890 [Rhodospirillales bacterium]|jgi:TPR repeat protein|nr:hypothetical protein [Rhodospirillales bacterium]
MAKPILKILAGLVIAIVLLVPGVAMFVDDETLSGFLGDAPVLGPYTDQIVAAKRDSANAIADTIAGAVAGLDSIYMDVFGSSSPADKVTKKVVIDLSAPPPQGAIRPPPQSSKATAPPPPPPQAMVTPPAEPEFKAAVEKSPPAKTKTPKSKPAAKQTAEMKPRKIARKTSPDTDAGADQDHKRGLLFYKGIGVDKDFKKAAQWFKRAAKKKHSGAQYNLGIMSYLGQGVPQDYAQAALWFQKAGEQDHAAAQYNLGFLYYEGKGVEKDDLQAFMWIDRSANLGDDKAMRARETLQKALPREIFNQ